MDDWTLVSAEAARPPQFRTTTMSSNQISDTAAAKSALESQAPTTTQTKVYNGSGTSPYEVPSSNINGTECTETSGATSQSENISGSSSYRPGAPPSQGIAVTKDSLEQHQRKLAARAPSAWSAWIEGAAPGYAKYVALEHAGYSQPPRTDPSVASDNSYELLPSPVTHSRLEFETRATGTQFNDQCINPFLNIPDLDLSLDLSAA